MTRPMTYDRDRGHRNIAAFAAVAMLLLPGSAFATPPPALDGVTFLYLLLTATGANHRDWLRSRIGADFETLSFQFANLMGAHGILLKGGYRWSTGTSDCTQIWDLPEPRPAECSAA